MVGKSSMGSARRNAIRREWMVSWTSLRATQKGSQGESPMGKTGLSSVVSTSKYVGKAAAGVVVSVPTRMTEPLSLTLVVTVRGRVQLASLRTRAAMSGNVGAIREAWSCSEGEERAG